MKNITADTRTNKMKIRNYFKKILTKQGENIIGTASPDSAIKTEMILTTNSAEKIFIKAIYMIYLNTTEFSLQWSPEYLSTKIKDKKKSLKNYNFFLKFSKKLCFLNLS